VTNEIPTDTQACAEIVLEPFPGGRSQVNSLFEGYAVVRVDQLARQGNESPSRWFLFRHTRIHDNYHQNFLVYVNPRDLHRFLLAWKRQNAGEKGYTPSRATTTATGRSGATQIGSKRAFPIKLKNGLTSSRVQTDPRRPRSISVHAQLNPIFMSMGGLQAQA
jgi:hypothetical protein